MPTESDNASPADQTLISRRSVTLLGLGLAVFGVLDTLAKGNPIMADPSTAGKNSHGDIAPALADLTDKVLFDQVWERPGLSKRDRSLITCAALIALYRTNELPAHMKLAIKNGVTKDELVEAITHLAFYAGWPSAVTAVNIARQAFEEAGK